MLTYPSTYLLVAATLHIGTASGGKVMKGMIAIILLLISLPLLISRSLVSKAEGSEVKQGEVRV